jgi:hypothetical protein
MRLSAMQMEDWPGIMDVLLSHRADINSVSETYGTALHAALPDVDLNEKDPVVKFLLSKVFDVNATEGEYGTALLAVCIASHKRYYGDSHQSWCRCKDRRRCV